MTELEKKEEKYATEDLPDGYTRINLQKKEAYIAGAKELQNEFNEEIEKLRNRNAELRGMYVHSAREAGTYKQFLELKENGVVWHDLRKNPNDLPENQKEVLCLLWEDSYYIGYYSINSEMWHFNEFSLSKDENEDEVTAWCELPMFEVKE